MRSLAELETGYILAAERYDPRRSSQLTGGELRRSITLDSIVEVARTIVTTSSGAGGEVVVLDTTNAQEGVIINRRPPVSFAEIGSAKKLLEPRDVIVSRLRPYLRQVAYVDDAVPFVKQGVALVCSSEFFVLRSRNGQSIAFLTPFLLSEPVQRILSAAQEGGHHPRFNLETLLSLRMPQKLVEERNGISEIIENAVVEFRKSESAISQAIGRANQSMKDAVL